MTVEEHKARSAKQLVFAVLTVSDSRTEATDSGGKLARELIEAKGHAVLVSKIVKDEVDAIQATLREFLNSSTIDAIVLTGGTGISPRDRTYEAVSALLEIKLDGFGELFRHLSYGEIGTATILSRAIGGVAQGKAIFALPGSPKAVRLGLEKIILPEIGHILAELRRAQ